MLGLLMLLFLLSDAGCSCPDVNNILILNPSKLVVRHGHSAEVNCTSTNEYHYGMQWISQKGRLGWENKEAFVIWNEPQVDWDEKPVCKIKINQSYECSQNLSLTVYQEPESVDMVLINDGGKPVVEGPYLLRCDIINVAPVQNLKLKWYKGNKLIKTDTFDSVDTTPVNETGNLEVNLTREDNGANFRCEAHLELGLEEPMLPVFATQNVTVNYKPVVECQRNFIGVEFNFNLSMVPCLVDATPPAVGQFFYQGKLIDDAVPLTRMHSGEYEFIASNEYGNSSAFINITVEYAPEFQQQNRSIGVAMGRYVSLECEAEGNPTPELQWSTRHDQVLLANITGEKKVLSLPAIKNNSTFNCTAINKHGTDVMTVNVYVMNAIDDVTPPPATKAPVVCPLELSPASVTVRHGDGVMVNCSTSVEGDGMGWEATVGSTDYENVTLSQWKVASLTDWTITPKCFITSHDGQQCKIKLPVTVYNPPDDVVINPLSGKTSIEGAAYPLQCDIFNVAPVQKLSVIWYKGNETTQVENFTSETKTKLNVSSVINITLDRTDDGAEIRCKALLNLGPEGPQPPIFQISKPYITTVHYKPVISKCTQQYTGKELSFNLNMVPCRAYGNPSPTTQWYHNGKQVNQSQFMSRDLSGSFKFRANNFLGVTNAYVNITVQYGPAFSCRNRYEIEERDGYKIECNPEGRPAPKVTWYKDNREVPFPARFTRHNGGKYLVIATNQHGSANHTLEIDVLYAPEIHLGNYTGNLNSGRNETLVCRAEGNPSPDLTWTFPPASNVKETREGRQSTIRITEATSTNTGVYICTATNKLGNATTSTTLIMRDYTIIIILLVVFGIILVIFGLTVYCCKLRRNHGQYTVIPLQNNINSGDIPMIANGFTS